MRLSAKLAAIAATGTLTVAVLAVPAHAWTENLPACAKVTHGAGGWTSTKQWVQVANNCGHAVHWYINREGPNSGCYHTGANDTDKISWSKLDALNSVRTCS